MLLKHCVNLRSFYHIRKPRVVTQNTQSLTEYRKNLREARKNVHIEAKEYQDMIENQYLEKHAERMKIKYFNDQCSFRARISTEALKLQNDIKHWKKQDEKLESKVNKHIHDEDLKRINRERIKKIMTFESENYWYNAENSEQRLTDQVIFPSYVASTQYYHRLHAEALVYENYDFKTLHRIRSNQDVIKEKNRILIPIFSNIKQKIKAYKTDQIKYISYENQIAIDRINQTKIISEDQRERLLEEQVAASSKRLKQYQSQLSDPVRNLSIVKRKLNLLLDILGSWKQYTNILGMTSVQMMSEIDAEKSEGNIERLKKTVMNQIRSVKNTTFVDAVEEDTEDVQVKLSDYLQQLRSLKSEKEGNLDESMSAHHSELDSLMKEAQESVKSQGNEKTTRNQTASQLSLGGMVEGLQGGLESIEQVDIPQAYLNIKETTSSIEVMKEMYKDNQEITLILNKIGQVPVEYSKLFKNIWDSTHSAA